MSCCLPTKNSSKSTKIYIGNIPENCTVDQLCELFSKYGRVEECDVIKNYGFVHMSSEVETKTAIQELNGYEFMGSKLSVAISHSKVRPKPGMGGKSQCYRCGRIGHWSKECPRNLAERVRGSIYQYNRYYPYGNPRVYSALYERPFDTRDHYQRLDYYRDFIEVYNRNRHPFPGPYERRFPPDIYRRSEQLFRRSIPEPVFDDYCERRLRGRCYRFDNRTSN
ncbi:RNA-binding protein 4B-like [Oppia nitens]|uniref:RNA-binding protein 4B-like n=1 Tax=Oppia nitens TaxID=1686743 RepID=UPI0023DCE887|nr:RNA-binding protein 4B-like [Oppia nitens]